MNSARNTGRTSNFARGVFCLFYPSAADAGKPKLRARSAESNQVLCEKVRPAVSGRGEVIRRGKKEV